jgi:predicted aspartyl protease
MINNQPFRMVVDTGDVYTVLSTEVVDELGLRYKPLSERFLMLGGVYSSQAARADTFSIGNLNAKDFTFVLMPQWAFGVAMDGLLGPDIMSNYDVDLDFADAKFSLFSQDHCPGKVVYWTKDAHAAIPVTLDHYWHISAPATLDVT